MINKKMPLYYIVVVFVLLVSCQAQEVPYKFKGISLVASREKLTDAHIEPIKNLHANSVALMPYAFMKSLDSPMLYFNRKRQFFGERVEGIRETVRVLHKDGLEVMLKPQIWIGSGDFTGEIQMNSEEEWRQFEKNYTDYILLYAKLAQQEKIEIFSLGTELHSFTKARLQFWKDLIVKVRKVYSGKLTYAENWDKIEQVPFWKNLDYIGVDAYFPLNSEKSPSLKQLKIDWQPHKSILKNLSISEGKPVLFTEYGYRSIDYATKAPWDSSREIKAVNEEVQATALNALYQELWNENWFAGGFLWKWHHDYEKAGGPTNNQFTVQNKLAEKVVGDWYANY